MNFQTKYRNNKRLIYGYMGFLEECSDYEERLKLCVEIGRLQAWNQHIEKMSYEETQKEILVYTLKIPSHEN